MNILCDRNLGLSTRWIRNAMRYLLRIINPYIHGFRIIAIDNELKIANPKEQRKNIENIEHSLFRN